MFMFYLFLSIENRLNQKVADKINQIIRNTQDFCEKIMYARLFLCTQALPPALPAVRRQRA